MLARAVLLEKLEALDVQFELCKPGELVLCGDPGPEVRERLMDALSAYGITMLSDKQSVLVERIKSAIDEMLKSQEDRTNKVSEYLSDRLRYSYPYLSALFSEATFTSIENYIILRKVDLVKDLLSNSDLTLTEIAYKLHYSSVAHLSAQFKKTTGLTPTTFQRILTKRRERQTNQY